MNLRVSLEALKWFVIVEIFSDQHLTKIVYKEGDGVKIGKMYSLLNMVDCSKKKLVMRRLL